MTIDIRSAAGKTAGVNLPLQQTQLASVIASAMDAIISVDADQRIVLFNAAAEAMFRCSAADALGQPLDRFIPERFRTAHRQHIRTFGQIGETRRHVQALGQLAALRADGAEFPIEASISQSGADGNKLFTVIVRDISERQQAEETLKEREFWLRESQRAARIGTYRFDIPAGTWDCTEVLDSIFGIDRAYPKTVEGWLALIHPDERNEMQAYLLNHVLGSKKPFDREYRILRPSDRQERWVMGRGELTLDQHGAPTIMMGTIQDITERKQAEAVLRESEERLRLFIEHAPAALAMFDRQMRYLAVSKRWMADYGLGEQNVLGKSHYEVFPEVPEHWKQVHRRGLMGEVVRADEDEFRRQAGATQWLRWEVRPWHAAGGEVGGIVIFTEDITGRKQAEEALRASESKYRSLVSEIHDGFYVTDAHGVYTFANPALARIHGVESPEALVGRTFSDLVAPESRLETRQAYQDAMQSGHNPEVVNGHIRRPDGTQAFVEIKPVHIIEAGQVVGSQGVVRDVTERIQREQELQALATVSAALRVAPTRADMLPVILEQLSSLLKAEGAALAMRDQTTGETVLEQAHGAFVGTLRPRLPPGEGVSGHVMATGAPYVTADIRTESRLAWPELLTRIRAVACVPLTAQGVMLGALWVGRPAAFSPGEVRLLTAIADMAANAIYRATLHEQAQRSVDRLIALRTIDIAIVSNSDLHLTLMLTLEQAAQQLQVDAADVLLVDQVGQTLHCAAARGFRGPARRELSLPIGGAQTGLPALGRDLIKLPDLAEAETPFAHATTLAGEDFRAYFAAPLVAKNQVLGVLEVFQRAPLSPDHEWLDFLEALAGQITIAVENGWLFDGLQRSNVELSQAYDATIEGWSRALDLRDKETEGHTLRVTEMTLRLARAMRIDEDELIHVRRGALLHDIGKLGVPDAILLKPGKLTEDEWVIMRQHPVYAYDLLSPIEYLKPALDIPHYHHEKWDGTGYPHGLSGEQIPLVARIFAVVDVWDALRSDRPYRPGWPLAKVYDYLRDQAGKHFDPLVVEAFLTIANRGAADG